LRYTHFPLISLTNFTLKRTEFNGTNVLQTFSLSHTLFTEKLNHSVGLAQSRTIIAAANATAKLSTVSLSIALSLALSHSLSLPPSNGDEPADHERRV